MSPGGDTRTSKFRFDVVSPLGFWGEVLSSLLPTLAVSAGLAEAVSFFVASLVAVAFFAEAFFFIASLASLRVSLGTSFFLALVFSIFHPLF